MARLNQMKQVDYRVGDHKIKILCDSTTLIFGIRDGVLLGIKDTSTGRTYINKTEIISFLNVIGPELWSDDYTRGVAKCRLSEIFEAIK